MPKPVISVEHLTKKYDLGVISTGTLARDLERWWARVRKQPDPYTQIGKRDGFAQLGESIQALDDVSFTVEQGETLGIIGRNGAGKSTLLKILSRVTAPTSGVVRVKGRIGSLLEVGTGFHPELTGRENVYLNGAILGMKKAEVSRKFDEIVAFSGVEKFIDTPVKRYSSGMYVRLAFAVAAHLDPEILIVDEVLAVGDAEFQKKCLGKMGEVAGEGRTVLFVSHNMGSIKNLCKQAIMLSSGRIVNSGKTIDVVSSYLTEHTHGNIQDFSSLPRRKESSEARIVHAIVGSNKDIVNNQVSFASEIRLEVTVLGIHEIKNASIFILIKSASGEYLLSPFQADSESRFSVHMGEKANIVCTLPMSGLIPGTYFIDLGIFDQNFQFLDWIESALSFKINEDSILRGRLGHIIPKSNWEIHHHEK